MLVVIKKIYELLDVKIKKYDKYYVVVKLPIKIKEAIVN